MISRSRRPSAVSGSRAGVIARAASAASRTGGRVRCARGLASSAPGSDGGQPGPVRPRGERPQRRGPPGQRRARDPARCAGSRASRAASPARDRPPSPAAEPVQVVEQSDRVADVRAHRVRRPVRLQPQVPLVGVERLAQPVRQGGAQRDEVDPSAPRRAFAAATRGHRSRIPRRADPRPPLPAERRLSCALRPSGTGVR